MVSQVEDQDVGGFNNELGTLSAGNVAFEFL